MDMFKKQAGSDPLKGVKEDVARQEQILGKRRAAVAEEHRLIAKFGLEWEYHVLHVFDWQKKGVYGGGTLEAQLNELGRQGWELVNVVENRALFKRHPVASLAQHEKVDLEARTPDAPLVAQGDIRAPSLPFRAERR